MILIVFSVFSASAMTSLESTLPSRFDAHGWALRLRGLPTGPYLAGEGSDYPPLAVILFNKMLETRSYPSLLKALETGELGVNVTGANGQGVHAVGEPALAVQQLPLPRLEPGQRDSGTFPHGLSDFGYLQFKKPGTYRVQASLDMPQGTVFSPPYTLEVVDIPADDVLVNHVVPLEGRQTKLPLDDKSSPFIQQVKVGSRTLLIYRRYAGHKSGGGVEFTRRIVELPGKVEMTVTGAYGDEKPLTIKYRDANAPTGTTTLVVSSSYGTPWKEPEKVPPANGKDGVAPAPRSVNPRE